MMYKINETNGQGPMSKRNKTDVQAPVPESNETGVQAPVPESNVTDVQASVSESNETDNESPIPKNNETNGGGTRCSYCDRHFNQYKALYVHMRKYHKDKPINFKKKPKIICSICDENQLKMKTYWDHIHSKHAEVKLSFEKKFFYSEEDFDAWRKDTEARTHTHFLCARSNHTLSDGRIVQQFQCDRSGSYTPSATRTRILESKKIGKFCPAYITRTKTVADDLMEIEVDFQSTHAGHKFDVHALRIRSAKHERRLRNKGKGRWPKLSDNLPPEMCQNVKIEPDIQSDEQCKSFVTEISDILHNDPDLEIQHVHCNCQEYAESSTCRHIQELFENLDKIKSLSKEKEGVDENNKIADPPCVVSNVRSIAKYENPKETYQSLEDEKTSVLEEFRQLVNTCENREKLQILKDIIVEGKKHLFSASDCKTKKSSHSPKIVNNAHLMSLRPYVIYTLPNYNLATDNLSCQNNLIVLNGGVTTKTATINK